MNGQQEGREHLVAAADELRTQVPTATFPHRIDGQLSIDHLAVAAAHVVVVGVERLSGAGRSDHDCYVVELSA